MSCVRRRSRFANASRAGAQLGPKYRQEAVNYIVNHVGVHVQARMICYDNKDKLFHDRGIINVWDVNGVYVTRFADGTGAVVFMGCAAHSFEVDGGSCTIFDAWTERDDKDNLTLTITKVIANSVPATSIYRFLEQYVPDALLHKYTTLHLTPATKPLDITLFPVKVGAEPIICSAEFLTRYATTLPPRMTLSIEEVKPAVIIWFANATQKSFDDIKNMETEDADQLLAVLDELDIQYH